MVDVVETSSQGWLSRIMESIKGVLVGLVLVVAAFPLLFVNEGCAVKIAKGLAEGRGQVVEGNAAAVNPALEGKLVHMTGRAVSKNGVRDAVLGVVAPGAIRLERSVEMFQWVEKTESKKEKKLGGSEETVKTTTYVKEWSSSSVSSADFKIKEKDGERVVNPPMPMKGGSVVANDVTVGAHSLTDALLHQLTGGTPMALDAAALASLPESIKARSRLHDGGIFVGDPARPTVGDLRIKLTRADATDVSIVAQQTGKALGAWQTSQGTTIAMLDKGTMSSAQMFSSAEASNVTRTWVVRLLGFLCMLIGFSMIFKPLSVVADVVPFIGSVVGMGTGVVAFALSAPLSLVTIAIAWIVYRPLLGIALLVAGIGIFVGVFVLAKKRQAAAH
jgi:hypothetical protein